MGNACNCEDSEKAAVNQLTFPTLSEDVAKGYPDNLDDEPGDIQGAVAARSETAGQAETVLPRVVDKDQPYVFSFTVHKNNSEDPLGMDVKHTQGTLEVAQITPHGAVDRANNLGTSGNPPGETLQVGDVIQKVNDVCKSDHQMVAECRLKTELQFQVARYHRCW
mmetsp:Transcript_52969/g.119305  ORF Transcript_52969/g.119305 Transcript_52969/m.119305 type:complete len:165 (+) Transcript_52969:121-615(+)